jgi:carboxyl-terminal processing protease
MRFFLFTFLSLAAGFSWCQVAPTPSAEAVQLKKIVLDYHLEPGLVDNEFARDVFDVLLTQADPEYIYFTKTEIDRLHGLYDKIDNDLNLNSWVFFPAFADLYEKALQRGEKILLEVTSRPLDLSQKEIWRPDTTWCEDEQALRRRWRLTLKAEILFDMATAKKSKPDLQEKEFLSSQEAISRVKAQTARLRDVRRIFEHPAGFRDFALDMYYKSISTAFDPHTVYFSPTQMENFMSSLSSEGYYFGFSIREGETGEIEVSNLLPGGPAWKSGEFSPGDVIEKLRWDGKEWMPLVGVTEDEVDAKLSESNQNVMEFELRKQGGMKKIVRLKKEKLNMEESLVRGFLLEGKRKIGYISLPDFYSSWGDDEGAKCAGDVAAEILKLRKQNIEGLILDVRYNGGGSLMEAVNMTGIFIDGGPVGIEKVKGKEPFTLKDANRGTVFDGPLVIMVNGLSASASEFLSAALQDYKRALIVGSNTYGKGSAQEMFSLRPGKPDVDFHNLSGTQWGFVKVTTGKTYRINGKSIQKRGVAPDVTFPDLADSYEHRELDQPNALASDSVNKKTYYTPLQQIPLGLIRERSQKRVSAHTGFKAVSEYVEFIQSNDFAEQVLTWDEMKKETEMRDGFYAGLKNAFGTPTSFFRVNVHDFAKPRMEIDDYAKTVNQAWIKNLSQDISLEETFNIICDYIDAQNSN